MRRFPRRFPRESRSGVIMARGCGPRGLPPLSRGLIFILSNPQGNKDRQMRIMKSAGLVLVFLIPAMAGGASKSRKDGWKYAGEDHGIRFFFKAEQARGGERIRLKLENTSEAQVDVAYRVMDTDWNNRFANSLDAHEADSTVVFRPGEGSPVRYPYFDQVYLERVQEAAQAETRPDRTEGPGRS
jgi:hypothetical protein